MFRFDVSKWVPQFILADKNGYALAKAIEAGMQKMNDIIADGVAIIADFDAMPEWRLDELAWESNCLYDYSADVEIKRQWIRDAVPLYRLYGTPQAIRKYIGTYFEGSVVEESRTYGADPFHFRVIVKGELTPENEAWARKAALTAKNVRSVFDELAIGSEAYIAVMTEDEELGRFFYPLTGPENYAGRWPQENKTASLHKNNIQSAQAEDSYYGVLYTMCGMDEI